MWFWGLTCPLHTNDEILWSVKSHMFTVCDGKYCFCPVNLPEKSHHLITFSLPARRLLWFMTSSENQLCTWDLSKGVDSSAGGLTWCTRVIASAVLIPDEGVQLRWLETHPALMLWKYIKLKEAVFTLCLQEVPPRWTPADSMGAASWTWEREDCQQTAKTSESESNEESCLSNLSKFYNSHRMSWPQENALT